MCCLISHVKTRYEASYFSDELQNEFVHNYEKNKTAKALNKTDASAVCHVIKEKHVVD